MPKPYVFVVCEKVIIDRLDTASLISLFNRMTISKQSEQNIPADAVAPKEWAVFISWEPEKADDGKEFVQCLQVLYPDGKIFKEIKNLKFKIEAEKKSQVFLQILGFPIGQPGNYTVRMWLERDGKQVSEPKDLYLEVEII